MSGVCESGKYSWRICNRKDEYLILKGYGFLFQSTFKLWPFDRYKMNSWLLWHFILHISIKIRIFPILLQDVAMEIPDVHGKELEEVKYTGNWIACFNMIHSSVCYVWYQSDINTYLVSLK